MQEKDGRGENMRGNEATEALFSRLHLNKTNMSAPVCEFHVSQRIYDRSSDRESAVSEHDMCFDLRLVSPPWEKKYK